MSSASNTPRLAELETAVERLNDEEYGEFRRWFLERDWETWDRQLETDSASGRLDFLAREARDEGDSGKLRDL
jgi:hypothetical protein